MTVDPGDRQVRSLLLTMSGRTPEERLDALRELAVTDPELASQLTILITQTGAYEQPSPPSPVPFDPGLPSRFQIVARIGQGGFGTVFKAYDRERQTVLALKVLHRLDSDALYRFKQEFRSLADLRHPNLIRFYDLFQHNDAWFFTMELVVGQSILDYVRPGARALFPRLRDAFHELISVISWLHRRRLIHRDLKPGNILVNERGQPVVLDFGLALHLGPGSHSGSLVVGTPAYMAPEQVSKGKASGAIDWYAVGVILYQALTGKLPFEGDMPRVLLDKVTLDPAPPAQLAPDIPPEWNDLCLGLLSREPETRVAVAERLLESASIQTAPDAPSPMLVGREDVLELLFDACTGAPAGKASVIELTGPSGYGKTKILDAFVAAAADRFPEALIVRGRCYEHESVPFKAVDEMMDQLSRELRRLGPAANRYLPDEIGLLARLFPVLEQVQPPSRIPPRNPIEITNPQEVRRRGFLALADLLQRLSVSRQIVICLDDLQWGDADSAAVFQYLLHAKPIVPLVLIASHQSGVELSPFLRSWRKDLDAVRDSLTRRQVEIGPLAPEASRQLARVLLGNSSIPADAMDALAAECRGEPLLLEQLIADFKRGGTQRQGATVRQLLEERMSRLSESAQGLLRTLAAAGEPLPEDLIARLAPMEVERSHALSSLISQRLVRRRDVSGGAEFEVYHDQIRAAIVDAVPEETLRALHLRIATGLVDIGFADAGVIALHFARAAAAPEAASYAIKGAAQAEAVFAFDRAARLCRIVLEMGALTQHERSHLYERMARAYASAGRLSDAVESYLKAAELTEVECTETVGRRAELRRHAAEQLLRGGKLREGIALLKSAGAELHIRHTQNPLLALASVVYFRAKLGLRGFDSKPRAESDLPAIVLARLDVYWALAAGLSLGNPLIGSSAQLRYLDLALKTGEPRRIALGMAAQGAFLALTGERNYRQSRALLQRALETGARLNDPHVIGTARAFHAASGYLMGRWSQAKESGHDAEQILREHCAAVSWQLNIARAARLGGLMLSGEWAPLPKLTAELIHDAQSRGDAVSLATFKVNSFMASLASDNPAAATSDLQEGERIFAESWSERGVHAVHLVGVWARMLIAIYSGTALAAMPVVEAALKRVKRSLLLRVETFKIITLMQEGTFWVAAATDRSLSPRERDGLLARAKRCADLLQKCRAGWSVAQSQLIRGSIAAASSQEERACIIWQEAERELERNDMLLQAAAVRFERARLSRDTSLETSAELAFRAQGVVSPERMAAALAPGGMIRAGRI